MESSKIPAVILKMWEKTLMPETNLVDGKREKTGNKVEYTTYHFLDQWGNKLSFLSNQNKLRELEGKEGTLLVRLYHDDFKKQNKISFVGFVEA